MCLYSAEKTRGHLALLVNKPCLSIQLYIMVVSRKERSTFLFVDVFRDNALLSFLLLRIHSSVVICFVLFSSLSDVELRSLQN